MVDDNNPLETNSTEPVQMRNKLGPVGYGTADMTSEEECIPAVISALEAGYRHVDTAQWYHNESLVGEAIRQADINRSEVTIATKLFHENLSYDDVLSTTKESLDRLGVDTIDLLYVHWPIETYDPEETLPAMDALVERGLVEHLGVSNFTEELLREARSTLREPIVAHQIEIHPLYPNEGQVEYCLSNDILPVGYSPLAGGKALEVDEIQQIAAQRDITPAQVCLSWARLKGVVPIPRGRGEHVHENYAATDIDLPVDIIERINEIDRENRTADPDWAPWN